MKKIFAIIFLLLIFFLSPQVVRIAFAQNRTPHLIRPVIIIPANFVASYTNTENGAAQLNRYKDWILIAMNNIQNVYKEKLVDNQNRFHTFDYAREVLVRQSSKSTSNCSNGNTSLYTALTCLGGGPNTIYYTNEGMQNASQYAMQITEAEDNNMYVVFVLGYQGGFEQGIKVAGRDLGFGILNQYVLDRLNPDYRYEPLSNERQHVLDSRKRSIAVTAHELGHALGLLETPYAHEHPCNNSITSWCNDKAFQNLQKGIPLPPSSERSGSVMGYNFENYPFQQGFNNTRYNPEKWLLYQSPFIYPGIPGGGETPPPSQGQPDGTPFEAGLPTTVKIPQAIGTNKILAFDINGHNDLPNSNSTRPQSISNDEGLVQKIIERIEIKNLETGTIIGTVTSTQPLELALEKNTLLSLSAVVYYKNGTSQSYPFYVRKKEETPEVQNDCPGICGDDNNNADYSELDAQQACTNGTWTWQRGSKESGQSQTCYDKDRTNAYCWTCMPKTQPTPQPTAPITNTCPGVCGDDNNDGNYSELNAVQYCPSGKWEWQKGSGAGNQWPSCLQTNQQKAYCWKCAASQLPAPTDTPLDAALKPHECADSNTVSICSDNDYGKYGGKNVYNYGCPSGTSWAWNSTTGSRTSLDERCTAEPNTYCYVCR